MASYGDRIRTIKTAEINRVLREGQYSRWAYFVDEDANKVGVLFANDTDFAAYDVDESPDPKLHEFGHEKIADLIGTPDKQFLVLTAGENEFVAAVFNDPMQIEGDDFTPAFSYDTLHDWQRFLSLHGLLRNEPAGANRNKKVFIGVVIALIIVFVIFALMDRTSTPGQ